MRKIKLINLLEREGKTNNDVIKWAYYGYGFLSCTGENKVSEIPGPVKISKCFDVRDGVYCVDGAL